MPQDHNTTQNIAATALETILTLLPIHAEEGGRHDDIAETTLVNALVEAKVPKDTAITLIYMLRRQFEALALLDPVQLHQGCWAFVSFPAFLLACAWMTTLATPGQALLPPDYWDPEAPDANKEEQRALLHRIETARTRHNADAQPIRFVHVAWAWIRIGDQFLLHRREDKQRSGEKSYGLPGGRFNLHDLPSEIRAQPDILRKIFTLDSEIIHQHIDKTLERELKEETDLERGTHYTFKVFGKPLAPYMEVNGAGNKHAYTAYQFYLYHIALTNKGETHLLAQMSNKPDRLQWFSTVPT